MQRTLRVIAGTMAAVAVTAVWPVRGAEEPGAVQPQMLASIPLRNNSGSELYYFLAEGRGWKSLTLQSGAEADLPQKEAVVAVPTTDDNVGETPAPTSLPDEVLRTPFVHQRPYFFRQLKAGERWELCWSQKRDCWLVQRVGEGLCQ